MTEFIINGPGAAPASQLKRFLAIQQILSGFSDGIDGERLQAALAWAMDGKSNYQHQHLISLFAAPWVAAQEEAGWQGDAFLQGEKDLNEITAVALQSDPVEDFLDQVRAELAHARSNVRKEAVQTAAMAARVVLDGDASVNDWRAAKGLDPLTGGAAADLTPGITLRHRDGRTGTFVSLEEDGRYRVRSLKGPGFWVFHPADCWPAASELAPPKGSETAHG